MRLSTRSRPILLFDGGDHEESSAGPAAMLDYAGKEDEFEIVHTSLDAYLAGRCLRPTASAP